VTQAATLEIIRISPRQISPQLPVEGEVPAFVFHALVATDIEGDNIRVVTMYLPDPEQWDEDGRLRRAAK
jgi:hypothetical protein